MDFDSLAMYKREMVEQVDDSVVRSVISKYSERSILGKQKYGTTLDRNDLNSVEWLTHLQEELMDATLYLEKLKSVMQTHLSKDNEKNKTD